MTKGCLSLCISGSYSAKDMLALGLPSSAGCNIARLALDLDDGDEAGGLEEMTGWRRGERRSTIKDSRLEKKAHRLRFNAKRATVAVRIPACWSSGCVVSAEIDDERVLEAWAPVA
jgi:hypothetical protein